LKSEENPSGLFTEQELYMIVTVIFTAVFFDFEPTKSFQLRMVAHQLSMMLGKLIEANVKFTSATGFAAKLTDGLRENKNALAEYGVHMVRQLIASGLSPHEIAFSQILPTACAMVPNQAQVVSMFLCLWNEAEFHSSLKSWTTISEKVLNTGQRSIGLQRLTHQKTMRS
jgi:linoleate 10R-lipoxygenase